MKAGRPVKLGDCLFLTISRIQDDGVFDTHSNLPV
jgi:hypothetical protein